MDSRTSQFSLRTLLYATAVLAAVCGLVAWHGIDVLFVIIPNAIAAIVGLVVGSTKRKAAAASLFALFAGWSAAFVVLIGWQVHSGGFGYVTDFQFWLFWPAMIVALAWLLFVVPLIVFAKPTGIFYRPLLAAGAWAGLAVLAYVVLVCTWAADAFYLIWFPALVGGTAGLLFPLLARSRFPSYLFWASPSIIAVFVSCVLWPSLEFMAPNFTYTYGTPGARDRSLFRVVRSIKVGDSSAELQRRYPAIFPYSFSSGGATDSQA
jgi:hypothetical protein